MVPRVAARLRVCLLLTVGCKQSDSEEQHVSPPATVIAGAATLTIPVRVELDVDGKKIKFAIPVAQPAVFARETWTQKLALVAANRSEQRVTLQVLAVPTATDAKAIDMAKFGTNALASLPLEKGGTVVLVPGTSIPADGLGSPPPKEIRITWLR